VLATQAMQLCADQAVQILGGMGFMRGTTSERIYREGQVSHEMYLISKVRSSGSTCVHCCVPQMRKFILH
jgi:alkylation response protein AidB-like acyl-CoA dehydrogenase